MISLLLIAAPWLLVSKHILEDLEVKYIEKDRNVRDIKSRISSSSS